MRIVTNQENCFNTSKPKRNCSSKYKGVCYVTNSYTRKNGSISEYSYWVAYIKKDGKRYHLGTFNSEIEAAKTYDNKALELFGKYANINFKNE